MNLQDKNGAVIGYGVVGKAAVRYLLHVSTKITLFDSRTEADFPEEDKAFLLQNNISVVYSVECAQDLSLFDFIVSSPGISRYREDIKEAEKNNIPVYTDVTLFLEVWKGTGPIIGVTGSNGKSTVVTLFERGLCAAGVPVLMGGNIGNSPLDWLVDSPISSESFIVLELSSYMMEYFNNEHTLDVLIIISFSQNHLSRHGTLQEYARMKTRGVDRKHTKVYLGDTPEVRMHIENLLPEDVEYTYITATSGSKELDNFTGMVMSGEHNKINLSFVSRVMQQYKVFNKEAKRALLNYSGLPHRIEKIKEENGVIWVNDSKSTSPDATIKAIKAVGGDKNIILIAGGVDKGVVYDSWEESFASFIKHVVLLPGPAEEGIRRIGEGTGVVVSATEGDGLHSMRSAVKRAKELAEEGDIVLLSPGAASLNLWGGFEARGDGFIKSIS